MEIENTFSFQATVGHLQSFSNAHGGLQESTMPELRDNKLIIEKKWHKIYNQIPLTCV